MFPLFDITLCYIDLLMGILDRIQMGVAIIQDAIWLMGYKLYGWIYGESAIAIHSPCNNIFY